MPAAKKILRAILVVIVILLLAAILIPKYLRTKIADGGDPAAMTLRTITSANETYSSTYGNGFAKSLSQLAVGPGTKQDCEHAGLIDNALASGRKYGYVFTYRSKPSTDQPAKGCIEAGAIGFSVNADPIDPSSENQHLFIDETGFLRIEKNRSASANSPQIQ
jgi:hypothetical protein